MMGTVFVAVAETNDSDAIVEGDRWAKRTERPLVVCHVVIAPPTAVLEGVADARTRRALEVTRARAHERLEKRVKRLTGRSECEVISVVGASAHSEVLEQAKRHHAVLIVVGESTKRNVERVLLGSSAAQIVRHADVAVLIARPSSRSGVIVAASDLSDPSLPAVEAAVVEASRRAGEVVALHCVDLSHPILGTFEASAIVDSATVEAIHTAAHTTLRASLERFGATGRTSVVNGAPKRAIAKASLDLGAALIVVATHGRSGLRRIALGSVAEQVARSARSSVLVVRSHQ
jgi:nucleotide-binding universal stress UspA family protein